MGEGEKVEGERFSLVGWIWALKRAMIVVWLVLGARVGEKVERASLSLVV
jgi:hypothetical protein